MTLTPYSLLKGLAGKSELLASPEDGGRRGWSHRL